MNDMKSKNNCEDELRKPRERSPSAPVTLGLGFIFFLLLAWMLNHSGCGGPRFSSQPAPPETRKEDRRPDTPKTEGEALWIEEFEARLPKGWSITRKAEEVTIDRKDPATVTVMIPSMSAEEFGPKMRHISLILP